MKNKIIIIALSLVVLLSGISNTTSFMLLNPSESTISTLTKDVSFAILPCLTNINLL